jgi:hypothetical protein
MATPNTSLYSLRQGSIKGGSGANGKHDPYGIKGFDSGGSSKLSSPRAARTGQLADKHPALGDGDMARACSRALKGC